MDQDGDGDFTQDTVNFIDEEGNQVAVTLKKGTKIKVEIVDILTTGSPASLKLTLDDNVTTTERDDYNMPFLEYPFVSQTVDNETSWEELSEQSQAMAGQTGISIEGDLVIISSEQRWSGVNETEKFKLNWKTGWWIYGHKKIFNETHTIWEIEYSTGGSGIPGFGIVLAFLSILIATIVVYKKRR